MIGSSHRNSRDPERWISAAVISAFLLIGGSILVFRGVRGLGEGVVYVTSGSTRSGPVTPSHAIAGGAVLFPLGIYAGRLARKKKEEIERK